MTGLFVLTEADEPPRSDAGQDVVIQLPTDWAVLDGRDSVDDHGISRYEWTLIKGDTAINMKVGVLLTGGRATSRHSDHMRFNVCASCEKGKPVNRRATRALPGRSIHGSRISKHLRVTVSSHGRWSRIACACLH